MVSRIWVCSGSANATSAAADLIDIVLASGVKSGL